MIMILHICTDDWQYWSFVLMIGNTDHLYWWLAMLIICTDDWQYWSFVLMIGNTDPLYSWIAVSGFPLSDNMHIVVHRIPLPCLFPSPSTYWCWKYEEIVAFPTILILRHHPIIYINTLCICQMGVVGYVGMVANKRWEQPFSRYSIIGFKFGIINQSN